MDISSAADALQLNSGEQKMSKGEKENIAIQFEKIFAKKLVKELTKDSFKMGDKNGLMGQSNNLYRRHVIDSLASEIAEQRTLGMADLITKYKSNQL